MEICRLRRQTAGEEYRRLGALELLDLRISGPLNGARIAYKGEDHPLQMKSRNAMVKIDGAYTKPGNTCEKYLRKFIAAETALIHQRAGRDCFEYFRPQ